MILYIPSALLFSENIDSRIKILLSLSFQVAFDQTLRVWLGLESKFIVHFHRK